MAASSHVGLLSALDVGYAVIIVGSLTLDASVPVWSTFTIDREFTRSRETTAMYTYMRVIRRSKIMSWTNLERAWVIGTVDACLWDK